MKLSRRTFLTCMSSAAILPFANTSLAFSVDAPYADIGEADRWMSDWMMSPQAANGPLHVGRFADEMYFLLKKIGWAPNPGQTMGIVDVPVGFVTDFASIPRAFWSLLRPDAQYTYPAIIHDYLYWDQSVSRREADNVFKAVMEDFKIKPVTIATIYSGVRMGGGFAWNENAKLKQNGEKRILKRAPENPTIRWADWKKDPTVF